MRLFSYLADQAFYASPTGDLLFYRNGQFSRPYIISDLETARRIYKKYVCMVRFIMGGFLIGNPFFLSHVPGYMDQSFMMGLYIFVIFTIWWVADKIFLSHDLAKLPRLEKSLRHTELCTQDAYRHNNFQLILACLVALIGFIGSIWTAVADKFGLGLLAAILFLHCGSVWGYTLFLKLRLRI